MINDGKLMTLENSEKILLPLPAFWALIPLTAIVLTPCNSFPILILEHIFIIILFAVVFQFHQTR